MSRISRTVALMLLIVGTLSCSQPGFSIVLVGPMPADIRGIVHAAAIESGFKDVTSLFRESAVQNSEIFALPVVGVEVPPLDRETVLLQAGIFDGRFVASVGHDWYVPYSAAQDAAIVRVLRALKTAGLRFKLRFRGNRQLPPDLNGWLQSNDQ